MSATWIDATAEAGDDFTDVRYEKSGGSEIAQALAPCRVKC